MVAVVQPHSISPSISQTVSFPNANQGLSVRSKVGALARMDVYFSCQEAYSISGSVVSFEFGCVLAGIQLCKLQAIPTSIDIELSLKRKSKVDEKFGSELNSEEHRYANVYLKFCCLCQPIFPMLRNPSPNIPLMPPTYPFDEKTRENPTKMKSSMDGLQQTRS